MKNSIKTIEQLNLRLKGFHKHFKGRFLFLQNKILTQEEYVLWDFSFSVLADWDKKNRPDNYGIFSHTFEEIGLLLACSASKISRNSKRLFESGLWSYTKDNRIRVNGFEIRDELIKDRLKEVTNKKGIINLQEYIAELKVDSANLQQEIAKTHKSSPKGNGVNQVQTVANLQSTYSKDTLSFPGKAESIILKSEEDYKNVVRQVEELGKVLQNKWFDPNPEIQELVKKYEQLGCLMLNYEIEHNLLPI